MAWSSLTRLEHWVVAVALLVLLLTAITSTGMLPPRSFISMAAGFVMLTASAVELVLFLWLCGKRIWSSSASNRPKRTSLLAAALGALPVMAVGLRLMLEGNQ
jgi:Ni,Fe-hydrogenase I cytochrome b subunit